jgi:hypothetical protein
VWEVERIIGESLFGKPRYQQFYVYLSRTLRSYKKNYTILELEMGAVVWSVLKLQRYLDDKPFTPNGDQHANRLHSDHPQPKQHKGLWKIFTAKSSIPLWCLGWVPCGAYSQACLAYSTWGLLSRMVPSLVSHESAAAVLLMHVML